MFVVGRTHHTYISPYYFTEIENAVNEQGWNSKHAHLLENLSGSLIYGYIYIEELQA